jgi:CheY-like chemotaxis protein
MNPPVKLLVVGSANFYLKYIQQFTDHAHLTLLRFAQNGEDAINKQASFKPDLILMDLVMDGMTGLEAARTIKEQTNHVNIILLSEYFYVEVLKASRDMQLTGYLVKEVFVSILGKHHQRARSLAMSSAGKNSFPMLTGSGVRTTEHGINKPTSHRRSLLNVLTMLSHSTLQALMLTGIGT